MFGMVAEVGEMSLIPGAPGCSVPDLRPCSYMYGSEAYKYEPEPPMAAGSLPSISSSVSSSPFPFSFRVLFCNAAGL